MSNFIRDCLDKAESSDFKSIAFPALGTGYLKYPVDIVVTKMIKGIKDFEKERKSTCIKEVRIVIYPESNDWIDIKQVYQLLILITTTLVYTTVEPALKAYSI